MEWLLLFGLFYFLNGIFSPGDSEEDDSEEDEFEEDEFEDDFEEEDESDIEEPKNNTNAMPTVTRVSGADLISKNVNRPTVINRKS